MSILKFLKLSRQTKKLTIETLMDMTGLSYGAIYRLLNGESRRPSPNSIKNIAAALGLERRKLNNFFHFAYANDRYKENTYGNFEYFQLPWEQVTKTFPLTEPLQPEKSSLSYSYEREIVDGFILQMDHKNKCLPYFEEGDIVLCNPYSQQEDGDVVLFKDAKMFNILFGQFSVINNESYIIQLGLPNKGAIVRLSGYNNPDVVILGIEKHIKYSHIADHAI